MSRGTKIVRLIRTVNDLCRIIFPQVVNTFGKAYCYVMAVAPLSPSLEPDDDQEAVAANIRALMGRYKVSQHRLAGSIGMSTAGLSERMNGKTNFTLRELGKIARFFGKSLGDVVTPLVLTLALASLRNEECPPPNIQGGATSATYLQQSLFIDVEIPESDELPTMAEEPAHAAPAVAHEEAA